MAFENGVDWRPREPHARGRHATFGSALSAALADLTTERSEFFDSVVDSWRRLFPTSPARPGRLEDGKIVLYVKNPPTLFAMRMKLAAVRRRLSELPGAPAKLELRLEVHP